jgi:hypothetical protein
METLGNILVRHLVGAGEERTKKKFNENFILIKKFEIGKKQKFRVHFGVFSECSN